MLLLKSFNARVTLCPLSKWLRQKSLEEHFPRYKTNTNMMVHRLIIGHWCIPLTDTRHPTNNENGCQGTECIQKVWIDVLRLNSWQNPSIRGHLCIPKYFDGERTYHWWMQVSRHSMDSRSLFQNKCSKVDGMESTRRRALRNPPSTNTRYITMLDNLEEFRWTKCIQTSRKCIGNGRHVEIR